MKSYSIDRNQNKRDAYVIFANDKYDLVYYFMPNGAMYLNKVYHTPVTYSKRNPTWTKDYDAVSHKKLADMVRKNPEIREQAIAMYEEWITVLKDHSANHRLRSWQQSVLDGQIEVAKFLIFKLKNNV